MTRAVVVGACALALVAAGTAGTFALARGGRAASPPQRPAAKLTRQQIGARKLLAEYARYGDCGCTGAARARDRVASGRAKAVVAASGGGSTAP